MLHSASGLDGLVAGSCDNGNEPWGSIEDFSRTPFHAYCFAYTYTSMSIYFVGWPIDH